MFQVFKTTKIEMKKKCQWFLALFYPRGGEDMSPIFPINFSAELQNCGGSNNSQSLSLVIIKHLKIVLGPIYFYWPWEAVKIGKVANLLLGFDMKFDGSFTFREIHAFL